MRKFYTISDTRVISILSRISREHLITIILEVDSAPSSSEDISSGKKIPGYKHLRYQSDADAFEAALAAEPGRLTEYSTYYFGAEWEGFQPARASDVEMMLSKERLFASQGSIQADLVSRIPIHYDLVWHIPGLLVIERDGDSGNPVTF